VRALLFLVVSLAAAAVGSGGERTVVEGQDHAAEPESSVQVPAEASDDDDIPMPGGEPERFWELTGYLEDTFNGEYLRGEQRGIWLNAGRGRLNLSLKPTGYLDLGAGVIGTYNSGETQIDSLRYLPEDTPVLPPDPERGLPGTRDVLGYSLENDLYFQEAFVTLYLPRPRLRLRVGRHKLYSGTGYAFNPTDLFNQKNPFDPTYEVDGLDAVMAAVELPGQTEIRGVLRFSDELKVVDHQARLSTHVRGWDAAIQYTHQQRKRTDWEALNTTEGLSALAAGAPFSSFESRFHWHLLAGELAGELGGLGLHAEGGYVFVEEPRDPGGLEHAAESHDRLLVGADHTFDSQLYLLAEYMRLGQGRADRALMGLNDRMAYLSGETLGLDRDTLFFRASYPLTDLMELSLNGIVGLNDPGALVYPWLVYDVHPGVKLSLTAYLPVAGREGQNGNSGPACFVRLKWSF